MPHLIKKISIVFLVVSLGWFPIQVTFAASFVMSGSNTARVIAPAALHAAHKSLKNNDNLKQSMAHCSMHKELKDCCSSDLACDTNNEQDCGHCLHFIAMTHERQQAIILPLYAVQNSYAYALSGITNISAYRPPR